MDIPSLNLSTVTAEVRKRRSSSRSSKPTFLIKQHKFQKVNFSHPTWCIFSRSFMWGLDKSGYECTECKLVTSRKTIALAKKTVCDVTYASVLSAREPSKPNYTKNKVFSIFLEEGQKKSIILNPTEPLRVTLEKICFQRRWKMEDFVARDGNGNELSVHILLGKITTNEITFTRREPNSEGVSQLPPLIEDVRKKLAAEGRIEKKKRRRAYLKSPSDGQPNLHEGKSESSSEHEGKKSIREVYTFLEPPVGVGAFSQVYQATHNTTNEVVAIKVIEKFEEEEEQDTRQRYKFLQEIGIMTQISHDNIVSLISFEESSTHFYAVMEMMTGEELFDQIIEREQFPEKDASVLICQILTAVGYLHSKSIVHRDLKPENLLFKDKTYTTLKIVDFGESTKCEDNFNLSTYCGTPDYMAPEILKGEKYGKPVDLWAIGVIAYVMMAGFPPFEGENDAEIFSSILSLTYEFPSPEWNNYSQESKHFVRSLIIDHPSVRLTAVEALEHPFITNHNAEDKRIIIEKSFPTSLMSITSSKKNLETPFIPHLPIKALMGGTTPRSTTTPRTTSVNTTPRGKPKTPRGSSESTPRSTRLNPLKPVAKLGESLGYGAPKEELLDLEEVSEVQMLGSMRRGGSGGGSSGGGGGGSGSGSSNGSVGGVGSTGVTAQHVDLQDLIFLQQEVDPKNDFTKDHLLKGLDIIALLIPGKSTRYELVYSEISQMRTLVEALPDKGKNRSPYQLLVINLFWKRLSILKLAIMTSREKKRGPERSNTKIQPK
eukprot:TRINITY_DN6770_c0_g1_i8.p1 TRINITY_DN6770_c0_g1~~TRINITY_DN6770_c0_g1_i8.p1  ORF type:complete len:797 (+),score=195.13 TRINITY_DN6770_c0_g1_i8:77-2392(+)